MPVVAPFGSTDAPIRTVRAQANTPESQGPVTLDAPLLPAPAGPAGPQASTPAGAAAAVPDRWFLMREVQGTWLGALLDDNRMFINGWIASSFTGSTDRETNSTVVWNDRANQFLMQQAWLRFGRSVVTSGTSDPTWGFQVDLLFGSDYRFTLPRGLLNGQLANSIPGAQNLYGFDPIQEYVNVFLPTLFRGTDIRFGRVYTPWGVESLEAVSTPLVSRSYAFNFSPPFTHCGLAAYSTITPEWSTMVMLANGNDVYFGYPAEELRFVGNVKWTQPGGANTVTLATSVGRGVMNSGAASTYSTVALATEPQGRNNLNAFDIVYTHNFNAVLSYNFEGIYGYQSNVPGLGHYGTGGTANWFSAAHYLFYTMSPQWTAIVRYENFDDFQGQRTGFPGLYTALTGDLVYRPRKDLQIRPELRVDYNGETAPFEGKHYIFTAAIDVIVRF